MGKGLTHAGKLLPLAPPSKGPPYKAKEWIPVKLEKPTREDCKQAASKLAGKPKAPYDDEIAIGVVIDALHEVSLSASHLEATVQKILRELPRWPDVPDIHQIAFETREVESLPNPKCPRCAGSGHRVQRKTVKGIFGEQELSFSERCTCWRFVRKSLGGSVAGCAGFVADFVDFVADFLLG